MKQSRLLLLAIAGLFGAVSLALAPVQVSAQPLTPAAVIASPIAADSLIATKLSSSWPWYLTRASGLIAAVLMVVLLLSGVGLLTGFTYRFLEPLIAWSAHRAVGIAFTVSVMVHIFSLIFDKFVGFSILDLLVPFKSGYQPATIAGYKLGSFYMALGILAMYLIIAIVVTSLLWVNKKQRIWHLVHFTSYAVVAMVFFHGMFMGTDLKQGFYRWLWVAGGVVIVYAIIRRLLRAGTIRVGKAER